MDTAIVYYDSEGNECPIWEMVKREPQWAGSRIQAGEKAIEEAEQLRSELSALQEEVERLRKDAWRMDKMEEILFLYGGLRLHDGNFDCKSHVGLCLTDERNTLRKAIDSLSGGDE